MSRRTGYTVVELLLALLILALLSGLALPALGPLLHRWRLQQACAALTHSAVYARSAAVSLGRSTGLCPSRDHRRCQPSEHWQQGWLVVTDPAAETPVVLRIYEGVPGLRIRSSQGRQRLRFQADGRAEGSNLSWTVCSEARPGPQARVVVSRSGRVRTERNAAGGYPACRP